MEFSEYQKQARITALYINKVKEKYPDLPESIFLLLSLSYVSLGLGEVGELQNKIKKIIRDSSGEISDGAKQEVSKEIGDIMWYCANMAWELGLNLDVIAEQNISKLKSRMERGVITGSGDNR